MRQCFDDPALVHGPVSITRRADPPQLVSQSLQISQLLLDRLKMPLSNSTHILAGFPVLRRQPQKVADLFDGKPEVPTAANELKAARVFPSIGPIVSICSCGSGQDANLLVITNRDDLNARFFRQFPNPQVFAHVDLTL